MAASACVSSLVLIGLGCRKSPRASAPPDAGAVVTVYVTPQTAERLMGRMMNLASRHQWVLSVRTDSAALADADLVIVDSAGTLVARFRAASAVAVQARQMAEAVLGTASGP